MAPQNLDLEIFAQKLFNSPTAQGKLIILQDWNSTFEPRMAADELTPRLLWDRLKSLGLFDSLLKWACVPSGENPSSGPPIAFNLQSASMIALARFIDVEGLPELLADDPDVGAMIRENVPKSYSASFGEIADGILKNSGKLSFHRVASLLFLDSIFLLTRFMNDDSILKAIDRDYVLHLVYCIFFDRNAHQPNDNPDKLMAQHILSRCGSVLTGLRAVYEESSTENRVAERVIRGYGISKVVEHCRAFFVDELCMQAGVVCASMEVVLSLLQVELFQLAYPKSDIQNRMLVAIWKCVRTKHALGVILPTSFLAVIVHKFALCLKFILDSRSAQLHRPRLTTDHVRDIILLGKAFIAEDQPRASFEDPMGVIQRYFSERHIDDATELQLTNTMISCVGLVTSSLHMAVKSGALTAETGNWVVDRWKEFLSKTFNVQMEEYSPWKRRIHPDTKQPYKMCYWYRCSLYRMESGSVLRQLLACAECQMASYCSLECQRSDWRGGQHKAVCKRPPSRGP